jgi:molybdate transport system permease protein
VKLSFFSSIVSTALAVAFAIPSGYLLARARFPGAAVVDTLLDMPIVLPPLVMGLAVLIFFKNPVGRFIDSHVMEFVYTWRGIILVQFVVGCAYAIRVVKAGCQALDRRYEEVAMTLGADRWRTFTRVSLPIIRPSLVAAAVISWARIFGLFGPVLLVAGTMRRRTEIMPTSVYLEMSIGRIEVALVIGAMMILMSVAVLLVLRKFGGEERLWQ